MVGKLDGFTWQINALAFSSGGDVLATGGAATKKDGSLVGEIALWDAKTLKLRKKLEPDHDEVLSVAFDPKGEMIAAGHQEAVTLWHIDKLESRSMGANGMMFVKAVSFSADGKLLAAGDMLGTIKLWSIDTDKKIGSWQGHSSGVAYLAFVPGGRTLVSAGSPDLESGKGEVILWDYASGSKLGMMPLSMQEAMTVCFVPTTGAILWKKSDGTLGMRQVSELRGRK